ncbi:MAG TPA: type 1 glutamine amidotransferase domain-containing protein [Candidatus Elarobacter sp.]
MATEGFERAELVEPVAALRGAGAVVDIISEKRGPVRAFKHHDPADSVEATMTFNEVDVDKYDGLLLPGGALNADYIRAIPAAQEITTAFDDAEKPLAVICHAPWMLVETEIARGRKLTSWPSIKTDLRNAGASWVDQEVCVDGNLVTSRKPDDIPAFNREFMKLLEQGKATRSTSTATQTART